MNEFNANYVSKAVVRVRAYTRSDGTVSAGLPNYSCAEFHALFEPLPLPVMVPIPLETIERLISLGEVRGELFVELDLAAHYAKAKAAMESACQK